MYGACCIIFYVHFFLLLIQKIDASWAFEKNKIQSPHLAIDFLTSSIVISRSFALLLSLKCKQKLYQPQACSHFHHIFPWNVYWLRYVLCSCYSHCTWANKFSNVAIALRVSSEYYVTISFLWLYTILNDQQTYGLQSTGL